MRFLAWALVALYMLAVAAALVFVSAESAWNLALGLAGCAAAAGLVVAVGLHGAEDDPCEPRVVTDWRAQDIDDDRWAA